MNAKKTNDFCKFQTDLNCFLFRMDMESTSKMRRHENTSSSEEDDLVDLLGNTYQVNKKQKQKQPAIITFYFNWKLVKNAQKERTN